VPEQGHTYLAFIEAELKAERDRRSVFAARGSGLVTRSGSLVTVLAALTAFTRAGGPLAVTALARGSVVAALLSFGTARPPSTSPRTGTGTTPSRRRRP
jgi:hypothetical protein